MNRHGFLFRTTAVFAVCLLVAVSTFTSGFAASWGDCEEEGKEDGKKAASPLWILAGLGCGCFGVVGAALFPPSPPAERLAGRSADEVECYIRAFKSGARGKNAVYAATGWAVWIFIYVVAILPNE